MPRVHTISGAPIGIVTASPPIHPLYGNQSLGQSTQPFDFGDRNATVRHGISLGAGALGALSAAALLYPRGRGWAALGAGLGAAAFGFFGKILAQKLVKPPTIAFLPFEPSS